MEQEIIETTQSSGTDLWLIIVAAIIVLFVLFFQCKSFNETRKKILELATFFPALNKLRITKSSISPSILNSKAELEKFISNPPKRQSDSENFDDYSDNENESSVVSYSDVDLIKVEDSFSKPFKEVVDETNAYLCKNVGTSAEFEILEDICERKIDAIETQIQNSLNIPLYLGLAGTFIGIIVGLGGIVFNIDSLFSGGLSTGPIQNLLLGVVIAMFASLIGLCLMTWNSAIEYKRALNTCYRDKNAYLDFIRRELMPNLSNSMAASLNSLKGVLGEFIGKFGRNLSDYANSAELLNDNIEKQHLLLVEINKMNQTKMAATIAKTFSDISEASESFNVFKNYQQELNATVSNLETAMSKIDGIITSFDGFTNALNIVVENQGTATELQTQFKAAIEQHFPTGSEAREQWRQQFDELTTDATEVSNELNKQLQASTEYIRTFVDDNKNSFESLSNLKEMVNSLIQYSNVQAECYKDLKKTIETLNENQIKGKIEQAKLNADLLTAVKEMITAVKSIKN